MKIILALLCLLPLGCENAPLKDVVLPVWGDNEIDVSEAPVWLAERFVRASVFWSDHGVTFRDGPGAVRLIAGDPGDGNWAHYRMRGEGAGEIVARPELEFAINPTCPVAHELGHVVGLKHVSKAGDLMSEYSSLTDDRGCPFTERDEAELLRVAGP